MSEYPINEAIFGRGFRDLPDGVDEMRVKYSWRPIETAPDGEVVMTKIDDAQGERNVQTLRRGGNLWWTPDGAMYVYYRPTHWRPA